jgi:pimeloyl-ACP methyl ester carboxylesterase
VLRGEHTEEMLALASEGVAERIPGARLVTVAGASHFLPMERPESVLAEIRAFIDVGAASP